MPIKYLWMKPLLHKAWDQGIHPWLKEQVSKSENELDDKGLEMIDVLVEHLLG
jgi:hypothetical protein